ncbi:MAG: hypothetical protein SNG35_00460 [Rikenellaceae bacterium]
MKRKIFNLSLLVMTVVSMVGCRHVPFSEYSTLADWTWVYSGDYSASDYYEQMMISEGDNISFMDCSQGYIDHKWIVPTNSGIYFLTEQPSSSDEFEDLSIIANANYVTAEPTIHLYFSEWSEEPYGIRLLNTYNKAVKYLWQVSNINYEATSTYIDGVHVADTTFSVRVYANYMSPRARVFRARADKGATSIPHGYDPDEPGFDNYRYDESKVYDDDDWAYTYAGEVFFQGQDGVPLYYEDFSNISTSTITYDSDKYTDVEVMKGQSLYFVDTSTDAPTEWTWTNIKNGKTYHSFDYSAYSEVEMRFSTLTTGNSTTYDAIKLKVARTDESDIMPTANNKTVTLPISVTVNGSALTPEITSALQSDGTILVSVSNANFNFDEASFSYANFFAMYQNTYDDSANTGVDNSGANMKSGTVTFTAMSYEEEDADLQYYFTLTPSETLYNTDDIRIFWDTPLYISDNETETVESNLGTYTFGSYSASAFSEDSGIASTTTSYIPGSASEIDFYYDFDVAGTPLDRDYDSGAIEWTVLMANTSTNIAYRTAEQPEIVDDPVDPDSGNKVLKVVVPERETDPDTGTTLTCFLIAGKPFVGMSGSLDNPLGFSVDISLDKECVATTVTNPNFYYKFIPMNNSDVVTSIDPANDSYKFDFDFRDQTADGSSGGWLYHFNANATSYNNGHYYTNASTGTYASVWATSSDSVGYGFYDCDPSDEDDRIFMSVVLMCTGTVYFDNFTLRDLGIRTE